jgi:hypothetical protein
MSDERREAQPPTLVGIEPDELAADIRMQRAVHRDKVILDAGLERQPGQKFAGIVTEPPPRPGNRPSGGVAEPLGGDLPGDGSIVIAGDTQRVELPKQRDTLLGVRVVSDDVPETYDAIHGAPGNVLQGRSERLEVGMDI